MMKKLLTCFTLLTAIGSFAQDIGPKPKLLIENVSYGDQMSVECASANCNYIKVIDEKGLSKILLKSTMNETIKNRRGYYSRRGPNNQEYYELTDDTMRNIRTNINEGYNGKVIGNSLLLAGSSVVDTVIILPKFIIQLLTPRKDSMKDKRAAIRLRDNLSSESMKVKHKYYKALLRYIQSAGVRYDKNSRGENLFKCVATEDLRYCDSSYYRRPLYVSADSEQEALSSCTESLKQDSYGYDEICSVEIAN